MLRFSRAFVVLGLLSSMVLVTGCEFAYVLRVVLSDLEAAGVDGLEVYRLDDATGDLADAGEYRFTGITDEGGREMITFEVTSPSGVVINSASWVERDPRNPNLITLSLVYPIELPAGWYKVAAYNEAGTSPPSLEQTFF